MIPPLNRFPEPDASDDAKQIAGTATIYGAWEVDIYFDDACCTKEQAIDAARDKIRNLLDVAREHDPGAYAELDWDSDAGRDEWVEDEDYGGDDTDDD